MHVPEEDPKSQAPASLQAAGPSLRDEYRTDIDGLRAIAVLSVVLFHAGVAAMPGGFVGVDIFFVISGYLIGAHIYRDVSRGRFSLASFYRLRAKRILPALFCLLLFCYLVSVILLTPVELKLFDEYAVTSVFSVSNIFAWWKADYFAVGTEQNPLLMTWSLGVEEHFYLFFPLLLLLFARMGRPQGERLRRRLFRAMLAVAVLSFSLSLAGTRTYPTAAFYLLPTRAWELAVGVLMAIHEATANGRGAVHNLYGGTRWCDLRSMIGVAAIAFAVVSYGTTTYFPGAAALAPVLGAALILSSPGSWLNRRLLSSRPFRWVGLVSYSWYLWHWPLLSFARICADHPISTGKALGVVLLALVFAWLSYRFVEQPFRHSTTPTATLLRRYAVAGVLVALPGVVMIGMQGLPQRFPALAAQDVMLDSLSHPCVLDVIPASSQECLPVADGRPAVALVGDSHAEALSSQLNELAGASGMRLLRLIHTSCPPLLGVAASTIDATAYRSCLQFNQAAQRLILDDPTVHLVVLAGLWAGPMEFFPKGNGYLSAGQQAPISQQQSDANFEEGLDAMIAPLRRAGKRVILLQDYESLRFDPVRRVSAYMIPARGWIARLFTGESRVPGLATSDEMYVQENASAASILSQVAVREDADIFDTRSQLCSGTACTFYRQNTLLYHDTNHLTPSGAQLALRGFPMLAPAHR
ncbi:MAG: acyltransferase family protein [Acidobacteriaceae bacterium]